MKLLLTFLLLLAVPPQPGLAIDPGRVQGSLQVNEEAIALTQAYAHLHDNVERLLDFPQELRLLLVDREVPQEALAGLAFLPVQEMAREGRVRGLLMRLDPNDHRRYLVTLLYPPAEPGHSLLTQMVSSTGQKAAIELNVGTFNRVGGMVKYPDEGVAGAMGLTKLAYSLRFSAPLFHEPPVTAVLVGQAAKDSPQMRVFREKTRALAKGDFAALQRLATERANRREQAFLAPAGPKASAFAKAAAADMEQSAKRLKRVVVRGERAVAIFADNQWYNFAREKGEWKFDD